MTRINTVSPSDLSNTHLMAEYRELPRIFTAVKKLVEQGKTPSDVDIPESYCLGNGHVKFFYDKLDWLARRFASIYSELMSNRGYELDHLKYNSILTSAYSIPDEWFGFWNPTAEDKYLNMARLAKRSKVEKVLKELDIL